MGVVFTYKTMRGTVVELHIGTVDRATMECTRIFISKFSVFLWIYISYFGKRVLKIMRHLTVSPAFKYSTWRANG